MKKYQNSSLSLNSEIAFYNYTVKTAAASQKSQIVKVHFDKPMVNYFIFIFVYKFLLHFNFVHETTFVNTSRAYNPLDVDCAFWICL